MTSQDTLKQHAASAAIELIDTDGIIGVGSGSTVNAFIDALASIKHRIDAAVPASKASEERLRDHGIPIADLNNASDLSLYVDGADAFTQSRYLTKGGGGALTREKIIAAVAKRFICIADESKQVGMLGDFPIPVEVIPMARSYVARMMVTLGGDPEYRAGFVTDNGNHILDVHHLDLIDPVKLETVINNIPGVVCNGIFAKRPADIIIMATKNGIQQI